jgi:hypothetical protein
MPDTLEVAANKIAIKIAELKLKKFDIGTANGPIHPAGYGGYYQDFQNGRIYTHHAIGTFEVHGGILKKFLSRNGIDVNTQMQRREMGFPSSDQVLTPEGHPINSFEWGEIIFFPRTEGGVAISGDIYKSWRSGYFPTFGYPLTSNLRKGRFEYCFFENGISIQVIGQPKVLWLRAYFPLLGNAAVVNIQEGHLPIHFGTTKADLVALGDENELVSLFSDHYSLQQVSDKTKRIPLFIRTIEQQNSMLQGRMTLKLGCSVQTGIMEQKGPILYDLVVSNDNGGYSLMSAHCIFHRINWNNFGLLHVTDIHVARRIDVFKAVFREMQAKYPNHAADIQEAIDNLNNWNTGFKDFIRYANAMYRNGVVDGIVATGDIVDYLFETNEFKDGGGNFKFFRDMVLGYYPYEDNAHTAEELLVPIYVTLGNHDYRVNPYHLFQRLDIPAHPDKDIANYRTYNLTKNEARFLQGANLSNLGDDDEGRVKVSTSDAKSQVVPAVIADYWNKDHLAYYKKYINYSSDFVVSLGKHKIIMIDSGYDLGAPDGNWDSWDAITTSLGVGNTDEVAFQVRVAPNSKGPSDFSINKLKEIKGDDGIVIVGMHAPPLNVFGNEYNHFFRETERQTADELEIVSFLYRNSKHSFLYEPRPGAQKRLYTNEQAKPAARQIFPEWFTDSSAFKKGSHLNFLHEGVSRENINLFLRLICGFDGAEKPIDLLLTGHNHCMSEIRIRMDNTTNDLLYFTDFYTENPNEFHRSVKYNNDYTQYQPIGIFVSPGAPLNGLSQPIDTYRIMHIPPYAKTLNDSDNKMAWWHEHKPLLIQGGPLGPTDHNKRDKGKVEPVQPSHEGCKLIIIRNDIINKIIQVSRKELAKDLYALPPGVSGVSFGTHAPIGNNVGMEILRG